MGRPSSAESPNSIETIAKRSLEANIITLPSGSYLTAGLHQFHSLWTRDFAFSIRGLLVTGHAEVVRDHLTAIINQRRSEDALVPRVIDNMSPRWRVIASTYFRLFGGNGGFPLKDPLKAEFHDEHGTEAIDSNAVVLLGAYDYLQATHDQKWWDENEESLVQIFHYYDKKIDPTTQLIDQENFADWQDSVQRKGTGFFTNLLYTLVLKEYAEFPRFGIEPGRWTQQKALLNAAFFDSKSGLYRSLMGQNYFSLDGNLLAIERGFFSDDPENAEKLYQSLKQSPFWRRTGTPGFNTYPNYPRSWHSPAVTIVGLGHYHDKLIWSWLMAYAAKAARDLGDHVEADRIFLELTQLIERDKTVAEIYSNRENNPVWESILFRAESPFSWGAASVLEYLNRK